MQEGASMKYFSEIEKPDMSQIVDRKKLRIPVTNMAALHLKKKAEWFSNAKTQNKDHSFRNDHMCWLALSCYLLEELPENMKPV